MTNSIVSSFACLPVTALQTAKIGDVEVVLAGQGSSITAHTLNGVLLWRERVFNSEAIHGIATRTATPLDDTATFLIYGTSKACLARLELRQGAGRDTFPIIKVFIGKTCDAKDWILHGTFVLHDQKSPIAACLVTAHNVLVGLSSTPSGGGQELEVTTRPMTQGPACILYSAYLKPISVQHILVAAGTVFGEIHVWSCHRTPGHHDWLCTQHYSLTGHRGSIFGVSISDEIVTEHSRRRYLASCSDDRTIRIWDVTDSSIEKADLTTSNGSVKTWLSPNTGFVELVNVNGVSELAIAWGHLSRIWDIVFLPSSEPDYSDRILLASRGEDASWQLWAVSVENTVGDHTSTQLHAVQNDRHHSGKNIWSMAFDTRHVVTGGADGAVVRRPFLVTGSEGEERISSTYTASFGEVFTKCLDRGESSLKDMIYARALKQYLLVGSERLLATTESGHLLSALCGTDVSPTTWELLYSRSSMSPLLLCSNVAHGISFMAEDCRIMAIIPGHLRPMDMDTVADAQIAWMHIAWSPEQAECPTSDICLAYMSRSSMKIKIVWVRIEEYSASTKQTEVELPDTFTPTIACYHPRWEVLILGSRAGAVALYSNVNHLEKAVTSPTCIRHVHGANGVTSILVMEARTRPINVSQEDLYILTTGRDGAYAVHRISIGVSEVSPDLNFETVHKSYPPFGPNIEGAYLSSYQDGDSQAELLLYGFRSKDFVVWNESSQTELLSIDCGGAHRSWAYSPKASGLPNQRGGSGGSFVWTKAGSVHVHSRNEAEHAFVQAGGHGREIKTLAKYPGRYSDHNRELRDTNLIATGAEDTTIRLFAIEGSQFRSICVLNRHTTGLQHLQFSESGKYLFSSAGCEEFFVWKLRMNVPCIGIGVVLHDSLPKDEALADARITSFVVRAEDYLNEQHQRGNKFLLAAAHSNGKVKLVRYTTGTVGAGSFEILNEIVLGQFCLTQVQFSHISSGSIDLVISGTNGQLCATEFVLSELQDPILQSTRLQIHQSSVKALETVTLTHRLQLVMTGGDDNTLGLTLIRSNDGPNSGDAGLEFRTLLLPKAHAASITALSVLRYTQNSTTAEVVLASSGNDQCVKFWRLKVNKCWTSSGSSGTLLTTKGSPRMDHMTPSEDLQVEKLAEAWTNVADASDMALMDLISSDKDAASECELLVVGVGMEMMKISFRN